MPACAVYGCNNYSRKTKNTDVRYYSFPKNQDLCKQWIDVCQRKDKFNVLQARICSKHFHSSAFFESMKHKMMNYMPKNTRDLKEDAVPTEFLPNPKKSLNTPQAEQQDEKKPEILFVAVPCSTEVSEKCSVSELNRLVEELKTENSKLKRENEMLKTNTISLNAELDDLKSMLRKHVGPGQIKLLLNSRRKVRWTP